METAGETKMESKRKLRERKRNNVVSCHVHPSASSLILGKLSVLLSLLYGGICAPSRRHCCSVLAIPGVCCPSSCPSASIHFLPLAVQNDTVPPKLILCHRHAPLLLLLLLPDSCTLNGHIRSAYEDELPPPSIHSFFAPTHTYPLILQTNTHHHPTTTPAQAVFVFFCRLKPQQHTPPNQTTNSPLRPSRSSAAAG